MFSRKKAADEHSIHGAKGNSYNFMVVFFAALGSFTYGFNSSIIGAIFGLPQFFEYFNIDLEGPNAGEGNRIIGGLSIPTNSLSVELSLTVIFDQPPMAYLPEAASSEPA